MQKKYDFGFGDTRGLREMTIKNHFNFPLEASLIDWSFHGGYAKHGGNDNLVLETKKLIKSLTGNDYQYILITSGATNALNSYLYAKKELNPDVRDVMSVKIPDLHYRFYPQIIKNQDLIRSTKNIPNIRMIDSPTNPKGEIMTSSFKDSGTEHIVWDAAYFSPTYYGQWTMGGYLIMPKVFPEHDAMVGSFSKFTSINGIRLGWIATNDKSIYDKAFEYTQGDICSANSVGQELLVRFFKKTDLESFYKAGNGLISDNKEELEKLRHLFSSDFLPENGMFAFNEVDQKLLNLFEKAGVSFTDGRTLGADYDSIRINLANTNIETKEMIKAILLADSVKP